ncbi:MAG: bacterial transcriptional activator domain-containing protein [Chloroflexota bacterium]
MIAGTSRHWLNSVFPTDVPLILLHPNFANQHMILGAELHRVQKTCLFVALHARCCELGLDEVWSALSDALSEQLGRQMPTLDSGASAEKAAQVALKALQPVGNLMLVIDGFDFADEAVQNWVAALANGLPANSQVIVASRQLPQTLIANPTIQGKVKLFPIDSERMLTDYGNQTEGTSIIDVYGLGPGRALINGKQIDRWDGMLPRSLFFYLIDRGMVTRDEIFQTFWPSLSVREATNVFHVTKRKISEILGFDLTVYWSGFYRISPDVELHYDVVKFAENVQNSVVADDDTAIEMLERAIYVYRGLFLSALDMEWTVVRRDELALTYADALSSLAKLRQRQGDIQEALGLYLRASRAQPHREDLARGVMLLFAELGQPQRALEVYNQLAKELRNNLKVEPDKQTTELAAQIRNAS